MKLSEEEKVLAKKCLEENLQIGLNCSESVFNAILRAGITDFPEEITRISSGLNGGIGASGHTCGALNGAILALSAVYGRRISRETDGQNPKKPIKFIPQSSACMRRYYACAVDFANRMSTCQCSDVINAAGGYFVPGRMDKCREMFRCGLELALKYIEMDSDELEELPLPEPFLQFDKICADIT